MNKFNRSKPEISLKDESGFTQRGFTQRGFTQRGFTFIELILVIVMIGILASVAAQKMIQAVEQAALTAEDMTIDIMRSNLFMNFGDALLKNEPAVFPDDPFANLSKVPEGYDRRRTTKPTEEDDDDGIWLFAGGTTGGTLTPEDTGTTLDQFRVTGFIYHQRKDHTIVKWAYDSSEGVIGKKILDRESDIKKRLDEEKLLRGETTESEELRKTR